MKAVNNEDRKAVVEADYNQDVEVLWIKKSKFYFYLFI